MIINSINFPDELIKAIRAKKLVIFAGAGVSMGDPANLPDFNFLADRIAAGSGEARPDQEPADRFLGRLHRKGVEVHQRAATLLTLAPESYTPLHKNLLRLFAEVEHLRVVTTNLDTLFEEAGAIVFDNSSDIYRAPALPLGHDFSGIVHVHGCLGHLKGMVLTDADFGRAYLTEGWARRFLVDLFQAFTVLFVGYSHDDVVMHYLSSALPESEVGRRYSLISDDIDPEEWIARGIEPIVFEKPDPKDFTVLNEGIKELADYLCWDIFDWKREITALASGKPPPDEESEHQILDALEDAGTARFFANAARDRAWLKWLDNRGIFEGLFSGTNPNEKQRILAVWLAENFAFQHPDDLILLIAEHQMRLNAYFWRILGSKIGEEHEKQIDPVHLSKWISVLLEAVPGIPDNHIMGLLAKRSSEGGDTNSLLQIFMAMVSSRLQVKEGFNGYEEKQADETKLDVEFPLASDHWHLNNVYEKYVQPILKDIAVPLLKGTVTQLERIHTRSAAWGKGNRDWDSLSCRRSAIEPHEQDNLHHAVDVLIDAARDSLVSVHQSNPTIAQGFFDDYSKLDAPILRRLSIHALTERHDIGVEKKLDMFLQQMNLHEISSHHEIYRFAANIYPLLNDSAKQKLFQEIWKYEWPNPESDEPEVRTARKHYNWFQWLSETDPNCTLAEEAKNRVLERYPEFQPSDHPDLTLWFSGAGWVGPQSPWTVEELLSKPASEWLDELLTFEGDNFLGPDRDGLRGAQTETAKKNVAWGFSLATELRDKNEWNSDLWGGLIRAWEEWPPEEESCKKAIDWLAHGELRETYLYEISRVLSALVRDNGKDCALAILPDANSLAEVLWESAVAEDYPESKDDWLHFAINNTAGVLAEFWLHSLSLWWKAQDPKPEAIPPEYTAPLESILHDMSPAGGVALSVLASQFAYFLSIDSTWTTKEILPWFDHDKDPLRMQQSWDGFLSSGNLNPRVFDVLAPFFLKASPRLSHELASHRDRFAEFFAVMVVFYIPNPLEEAIPTFFQNSESEDRRNFAAYVEHMLRGLNEEQQQEQWQKWLNEYWQNRLQGIPAPLEGNEIKEMMEWLQRLTAVFPDAVELATRMPQVVFEHLSVGYDLKKSELPVRYPNAVSKLLIHLMQSESPHYVWYGVKEVIGKLRGEEVDPAIWQELERRSTALGLI